MYGVKYQQISTTRKEKSKIWIDRLFRDLRLIKDNRRQLQTFRGEFHVRDK